MKTLRLLCATFVLTLALSLSAFAGDMTTGVTAPPRGEITTGAAGTMPTGIAGDIGTGVRGDVSTSVTGTISTGATATDPATEFLLSLLQSLLSLF